MRPTGRLVGLAAGFALAGIAVAFVPKFDWVWLGAAASAIVIVLLDALRPAWRAPLEIVRQPLDGLPLGAWSEVALTIDNHNQATCEADVFDGAPSDFEIEHQPRRVHIAAQRSTRLVYRVRPLRRGRANFGPTQLLRRSTLGLWVLRQEVGAPSEVLVLPNFRPIVRYALLAVAGRLEQMGIRRKARRGVGKSFHQLREYREGDLLQQVDWKATARRRTLISREYEEERDQHVVFLLDCGQRMRSVDGDLAHFDHCLNAMLLLSYIALRQGDSVSVMTFAGSHRWLPPVKGAGGVQAVLRHIFDLEPSDAPSDYAEAARRVLTLQRRRSLVVWLTNLRGEDANDILPAAHTLRARHLSVVASLREAAVDRCLEEPPLDFEAALTHGAAALYAEERGAVVAALRSAGVRALDLRAPELPVALANEYLDVKSGGAL